VAGLGLWGLVASSPASALGKIDHRLVQQVFEEICAQGIQEPQWVMRQAIIETGWMRSPFLMQKNNLFGFRKVKYLQFSSWQESIGYYKAWQTRNHLAGQESYAEFLQRIRYGSKDYLKHLDKIQWTQNCPEPIQPALDPQE
jgi:hypothetical protein